MKSFKLAKRNVFDLSHGKLLTCDMGQLVPILCEEVVPGDKFRIRTDAMVRLTPLIAPVMHRMDVFFHYWFVPTRLVHDNFEKFITGGVDGKDDTVIPTVKAPVSTGYGLSTLWDYFGLPTGIAEYEVLAYPFRAYNLIWNTFYKDENLQDDQTISKADGLDTTTNMNLLNRCWERDYFTKAVPFEQKGDPVSLPLGTVAPVKTSSTMFTKQPSELIWAVAGASAKTEPGSRRGITLGASGGTEYTSAQAGASQTNSNIAPSNQYADLTNATAATINDLRKAFKLQEWFELNMIGGSAYVEQILAHFGVKTGDARLQRPEFIGGMRSPIIVSEVLQNSHSTTGENASPLGNMAGHGYSAGSSKTIQYFFPEHGYVIGLMSIMPRTGYQQGSRRMWNRRSRFDFLWPLFSNLGYQAIENKELYAQGTDDDKGIFGYTGRYDEYRSIPNSVHGQFKDSLKYWHLNRIFSEAPVLNEEFVEANPATRIFATSGAGYSNHCLVQIYNDVMAIRPLPKRSIPGFN